MAGIVMRVHTSSQLGSPILKKKVILEGVVSLQGFLSVNHFQFLIDSVGTNSSAYVQGLYFLKIHEID